MPYSATADHQKGETGVLDDIPIGTKTMYGKIVSVDKNLDKLKPSVQSNYSEFVSAQIDRLRNKERGINPKQVTTDEVRKICSTNRILNSQVVKTFDNLDESRDLENKTHTPTCVTRIRIRQYKKLQINDAETSEGNNQINHGNNIENNCCYPKITFRQTYIRQKSPEMTGFDDLRRTAKGIKSVMPHPIGIDTHTDRELDFSGAFDFSKSTDRSPALFHEDKLELKSRVFGSPVTSRSTAQSPTSKESFKVNVSPEKIRIDALESPLSRNVHDDTEATLEGFSRLESSCNRENSHLSDRVITERSILNRKEQLERKKKINLKQVSANFSEYEQNKSKENRFSTPHRVSHRFSNHDQDISAYWRVLKHSSEICLGSAGSPLGRKLKKMDEKLEDYNKSMTPRKELITQSLSPMKTQHTVPAKEYTNDGRMKTDEHKKQQLSVCLDRNVVKITEHSEKDNYAYSRSPNQQMNHNVALDKTGKDLHIQCINDKITLYETKTVTFEKGFNGDKSREGDKLDLENDRQIRKHKGNLQNITSSFAATDHKFENFDLDWRAKSVRDTNDDVPATLQPNNIVDLGISCNDKPAHQSHASKMVQSQYSKPSNKNETKTTSANLENFSDKALNVYRKMDCQSTNNEPTESQLTLQNEFIFSPYESNEKVVKKTNKEIVRYQVPINKNENLTTSTQHSPSSIPRRSRVSAIKSEDVAQNNEIATQGRYRVPDDKIETPRLMADEIIPNASQHQHCLPLNKSEAPPLSTKEEEGGYHDSVDKYEITKLSSEGEQVDNKGQHSKSIEKRKAHGELRDRHRGPNDKSKTSTSSRQDKPEFPDGQFYGQINKSNVQTILTQNELVAIPKRNDSSVEKSDSPVSPYQDRHEAIPATNHDQVDRNKLSVLIPKDESSTIKDLNPDKVHESQAAMLLIQDESMAVQRQYCRPDDESQTPSLPIQDDSISIGEYGLNGKIGIQPLSTHHEPITIQGQYCLQDDQSKEPILSMTQEESNVSKQFSSPLARSKAKSALPIIIEQPVAMYRESEERKWPINEEVLALIPPNDKQTSLSQKKTLFKHENHRNKSEDNIAEMSKFIKNKPAYKQDKHIHPFQKSDVFTQPFDKMNEKNELEKTKMRGRERKTELLPLEKYIPFVIDDRNLKISPNNLETVTSRYRKSPETDKDPLLQERTNSFENVDQYMTQIDVRKVEKLQSQLELSESLAQGKMDARMADFPQNRSVKIQDSYCELVSERESSEKSISKLDEKGVAKILSALDNTYNIGKEQCKEPVVNTETCEKNKCNEYKSNPKTMPTQQNRSVKVDDIYPESDVQYNGQKSLSKQNCYAPSVNDTHDSTSKNHNLMSGHNSFAPIERKHLTQDFKTEESTKFGRYVTVKDRISQQNEESEFESPSSDQTTESNIVKSQFNRAFERTKVKQSTNSQNEQALYKKESQTQPHISDLDSQAEIYNGLKPVSFPVVNPSFYPRNHEKGIETNITKTKDDELEKEEKLSAEEGGEKVGYVRESSKKLKQIKHHKHGSTGPKSKAAVKEIQHFKTEENTDKKVTKQFIDHETQTRLSHAELDKLNTSEEMNEHISNNYEENNQQYISPDQNKMSYVLHSDNLLKHDILDNSHKKKFGSKLSKKDVTPAYINDEMKYQVRKQKQSNHKVFYETNDQKRTLTMPKLTEKVTTRIIHKERRKENSNEKSLSPLRQFEHKFSKQNEIKKNKSHSDITKYHQVFKSSKDWSEHLMQNKGNLTGDTILTQELICRAIEEIYSYLREREKRKQSSKTEAFIKPDYKECMDDIYSDRTESAKDRGNKITDFAVIEDGYKKLVNGKNKVNIQSREGEFRSFTRKAVPINVYRMQGDIERVLSTKDDLTKQYMPSNTDNFETEDVERIVNEADMLYSRIETMRSLCNAGGQREHLKQLLGFLHHACFDSMGRTRDYIHMGEMNMVLKGLTKLIDNEGPLEESLSSENKGETKCDDHETGKSSLGINSVNADSVSDANEINHDDNSRRQFLNTERKPLFKRQQAVLKRNIHFVVDLVGLGIITGITMVLLGPSAAKMMYNFVLSCIMYVMRNVRLIQPNPPIT